MISNDAEKKEDVNSNNNIYGAYYSKTRTQKSLSNQS